MKIVLSSSDIQKALILKLNRQKILTILLFCITLLLVALEIIMLMNLGKSDHPITVFGNNVVELIFTSVMIIIMMYVPLCYLRDYHKIRNNKFVIIKEKLYSKGIEDVITYKKSRTEYTFYFKSGKIFVEDNIYKPANVGDEFYLIMLNDKAPFYVFNKKHFKIDLYDSNS